MRRVEIDKPGSTAKRMLGIPTVMDRVCQQAVVQTLGPIFEPTFRDESFGFRPGRSTHMAMRRIWRQLKAGNSWVVDADIADFFGTLSHSTLVDLVAKRVADGKPGGNIVTQDFDRYPVMRMQSTPPIEVHLIESTEPPSGVGEVSVPTVAPALANAIFALAGTRIRRLPMSRRSESTNSKGQQ